MFLSSVDGACGVGDGPDADAVDGGEELIAVGSAAGVLDQGRAETVSEDADGALEQQQSAAAQQRVDLRDPAGRDEPLPKLGDDALGEPVGQGVELVAHARDELEEVLDADARGDAVGDEREQRRAADQEMLAPVGGDEAGVLGPANGGGRETWNSVQQLGACKSQGGLVEGGGAGVEAEQVWQLGSGVPGVEEVADAGERVAALLQAADELEAPSVLGAVDTDAALTERRGEEPHRLVLPDGAHGQAGVAGQLVDGHALPGRWCHHPWTVPQITVTVNTVTMSETSDLPDRLLSVLRHKTGVPDLAYRATPERLTGGFWAELLAFSLVDAPPGWDGQLVARVMPEAALAAKETAVQTAVAQAGVATPTVRGAGGADDGLGRAFMVMDRAAGVPLLAGLDGVGAILGAPARLWRMPDVLATVMAELHAVDPKPVSKELEHVEGVATTVPAMLEGLRGWAETLGRSDLAAGAGWLVANPRAASEHVVCHGDLHPFNVLIDGERHVTLLDWSAAVLAPRAYDVAFTSLMLANPPVAVPAAARPLVGLAGRRLAGRFVRSYRRRTDVHLDPEDLTWHQAVVGLRALVEVAQWVADGVIDDRAGHPWLVMGDALAGRLTATTGVTVRPR